LRSTWWCALAALAACSGGGGQNGGGDAGVTPGGSGLDAGVADIRATTGPGRRDPEGVAPPVATVTNLTWQDSRGADRTAVLGGYLYQYDYSFAGGGPDPSQVTARSANDSAFGHPGFGFVVSHNTLTGNSPLGKANAPARVQTAVFAGAHHAIHHVELLYDRDKEAGGNGIKIPVVIEWFVATGRDHPVWAVTWRTGEATNPLFVDFDTYRMDSRGPYGSLNWDGAASRATGDAIGGVAWGDFGLRFTTTDAQLTLNSPWTYTDPNSVAFTRAWTANANAEMGIVQTKPGDRTMGYPDRVVGRERGDTSGGAYLDKRDCNGLGDGRVYSVPCVGGWPYQLMNFDWDPNGTKPETEPTRTKLIAWGTPYGFVGASSFDLFDFSGTADGRGDRSYATFIVAGPKCRFSPGGACDQPGDVELTLAAVDALASATVTGVGPGSVVAQVARGPGATDVKPIANGYDDTYAVFTLASAANTVSFTFTPAPGKPVKNPIFRVQAFTAGRLPAITVNGTAATVNAGAASGAFVSIDAATNDLWVTLNRTVAGATAISIAAP
jgi:hypothetical protein